MQKIPHLSNPFSHISQPSDHSFTITSFRKFDSGTSQGFDNNAMQCNAPYWCEEVGPKPLYQLSHDSIYAYL